MHHASSSSSSSIRTDPFHRFGALKLVVRRSWTTKKSATPLIPRLDKVWKGRSGSAVTVASGQVFYYTCLALSPVVASPSARYNSTRPKNPTAPFTMVEPHDQEVGEFYVVHKLEISEIVKSLVGEYGKHSQTTQIGFPRETSLCVSL